MKKSMLFVVALFGAAPASAAEFAVTTSGGFSAVAHREFDTGAKAKAMVYSVLGSLTLARAGGRPTPLSAECLGFDEHGEGRPTVGIGRCVWKDGDSHVIYVSITTQGDRNVYSVTGGTGKWAGASGEIRTAFTYLPAPAGIFLLHEAGSGRMSTPGK